MFQHIGKKIQGIATMIFFIHIVISCILGIVLGVFLWNASGRNSDSAGIILLVIIGVALSIFLGWLSVMLYFAIGKIEEHCEMQCDLLKILVAKVVQEAEEEEKVCSHCGKKLPDNANFCASCGTRYEE